MGTLIKENLKVGLLIFLLCGSSCSHKNDQAETIQPKKDSLNQTSSIEIRNDMGRVSSVKVYMENSASMRGYNANNCKGFTSVISELVGVYGRTETTGYFYSDKLDKGHLAKKFSDMIAEKSVKYGKSSVLDVICDSIISKNNSISFLVTDGIMSGPDEKVTGTKYNIEYAPELQKNLENIIRMKARDYAISVYQFNSNYDGIYYCYDNKQVQLKNKIRPFYVIAIGKTWCVKDFCDKVASGLEYFKPINQVHFGLNKYPCNVLFTAGPLAELKGADFYVDVSKVRRNNKQFDLSACLSDLPEYMCTGAYIKDNSILMYNNAVISSDSLSFNAQSKTLRIKLDLLNLQKRGELSYALAYSYPQWCEASSSLDDYNILSDLLPKTFNLEYLIKAFRNGIENSSNVIDMKYNIIKN